jgi:hypothetical protein
MRKPLKLHEELLLLSLRDKEGTFASSGVLDYAIGGALLSELLLLKKIEIDESKKKKKMIDLVDTGPTGHPVLDECIDKLKNAKRRANLMTWVTRFARFKKLKHRVAEQLCHGGIVRETEDKVMLFFSRRIYPEINPGPENELVERMRKGIFTETNNIDPRTAIIIALASHVDLLKHHFDKKELKSRKKRIKEIGEGHLTAKAAQEAIQAMQAAVMVVVIFPSVIAGAATS